ncbi:hypothetical protein [Streptomyces sp. NPDC054834]
MPYSPKTLKYAAMETAEAISIEPKPTGLKLCVWARLNSTYDGLSFSGLLMTRSATTAPIQAIATSEQKPRTVLKKPKTPR